MQGVIAIHVTRRPRRLCHRNEGEVDHIDYMMALLDFSHQLRLLSTLCLANRRPVDKDTRQGNNSASCYGCACPIVSHKNCDNPADYTRHRQNESAHEPLVCSLRIRFDQLLLHANSVVRLLFGLGYDLFGQPRYNGIVFAQDTGMRDRAREALGSGGDCPLLRSNAYLRDAVGGAWRDKAGMWGISRLGWQLGRLLRLPFPPTSHILLSYGRELKTPVVRRELH